MLVGTTPKAELLAACCEGASISLACFALGSKASATDSRSAPSVAAIMTDPVVGDQGVM